MASRAVQLVLLIATIGLWSVDATRVKAEDDPAALAAALADRHRDGGQGQCRVPGGEHLSTATERKCHGRGDPASRDDVQEGDRETGLTRWAGISRPHI